MPLPVAILPVVITAIKSQAAKIFALAFGPSLLSGAALSTFDQTSKEICACLAILDNTLKQIDQNLIDGFAGRDIETERLSGLIKQEETRLGSLNKQLQETRDAQPDVGLPSLDRRINGPSLGFALKLDNLTTEIDATEKALESLKQRRADRQEELEKEREARSGLGQDGNPAPSPEAIARIEEALNRASEAITAALERLPAAQVSQAGGMPPLLLDPQPIGDAAATSLNDVFTNLDEMFAALSEHINSGFQATLDSLTGQVAETIDELKRMEEGIMAALPAVRGTVGKVLRTIS
ncbi:MAG: hypothetical protein ACE5E0_06975, partial [Terriglobia bacterium]